MRAAKYCNTTPAQAALYGAVAGLVATGLVSVLARAIPVLGFSWYSLLDQVDWDSALTQDRGVVNPLC